MKTPKRFVNVAIVGFGNVGKELALQVKEAGWKIAFVVKHNGIYNASGEIRLANTAEFADFCRTKKLDLVFICTPPQTDNGVSEVRYILDSMSAGLPVVTCSKQARANFGGEIEIFRRRIRDTATLMAGVRGADYVSIHKLKRVNRISATFNATLAFIFDLLSNGESEAEAFRSAEIAGIMEPLKVGQKRNIWSIIQSEGYGDVAMKVAIFCKKVGICKEEVSALAFPRPRLKQSQLETLVKEAMNWRFIVSIYRIGDKRPLGIGMCHLKFGEWRVSYGFQSICGDPWLSQLALSGPRNGILIEKGVGGKGGRYFVEGSGAGVGPTAMTMMDDADEFLF